MTEPNKTLTSRLTQHHAAAQERQAERAREHPVKTFLTSAGMKALGVVLLLYARGLLEEQLKAGNEAGIAIAVAVGLFALFLLAPGLTMTFMRFLGLGGLVDKAAAILTRRSGGTNGDAA